MQKSIEIKNFLLLTIGSFLVALGVVLFFIGNNFTTGGSPGAAILLHYLTGFSVGSMMLAFNIPLLLIGIKYLGKMFAIRTIVSIFLASFFVDFLVKVLHIQSITSNILLAAIFGGVIIGIGVGFILLGNASAGGSTIIARVVCANTHFKAGQVILFVDFVIIVSSIYVFKDVDKALWSILSIYVTSKCIDYILSGRVSKKVVHIVSNKPEKLRILIKDKLGEQGSILRATGLQNEEKNIIFLVVELSRLRVLKEFIKEYDSEAFMVVMDASELLGRGH